MQINTFKTIIRTPNVLSPELCGSCYAFASSGMNEARVRIFSNNTLRPIFSPQDIVDCSPYSQGIDMHYFLLVSTMLYKLDLC